MVDRWIGIILLGLSLVMAFLSWKLPLGGFHRPGPGLYPFLLALMLTLLAVILFISSWWLIPSRGEKDQAEKRNLKKVSYVTGTLFVYAFFFQSLGYLLSTFLFFLLLKPIMEKKWAYALVGALLVTLASYLVFDILLQSRLPKGIFGI